jgi:uncharacterized membrane protein
MDIPYVPVVIQAFSLVFTIFGAALIIYSGIRSIVVLILYGFHRKDTTKSRIMREYTGYIVFGLEFFIAGDVLATVLNPTIQDLTVLGSVVLIRVILGYFLQKESKEFDIDS